MKHCTLTLCVSAIFLTGCANSVLIGHQHGVNLETELRADMTAPVSLNFGYQSKSVVAVPPKKSLSLRDSASPKNVAEGELLSTYSVFRVQRDTPDLGAFTIRSGVATGGAATNVASQQAVVQPGGANLIGPLRAPRTTEASNAAFNTMRSILND